MQGERDIKQRGRAGSSVWIQGNNQLLERYMLMFEGLQDGFPHAGYQGAEGWRVRKIGCHYNGIYKEPHKPV